MVLLWKKPTQINKGIIIFTHKEINNSFIPYTELKKIYLLGLHIGCWFPKNKKIPNYVDFILSSPNQIEEKNIKNLIPYNSRNFLPTYFDPFNNKEKNILYESIKIFNSHSKTKVDDNIYNQIEKLKEDKFWDIITVAKPHHVKKLDIFLQQIKQVLEIDKSIKVLIISPIAPNEYKHKDHHHDLEKIIINDFTLEQQNNFTLLRPECGTNEGIDNKYIFPFYQWSKIFCFFTEYEGESRVAHEALCSGLPVVCFKHLKGGANEYLDNTNSIQFDKYDEAYKSILECLKNYKNLNKNYESMQQILREDKSIDLFKKELEKIYSQQNMIFDNELIEYDQLHFRLPGHYYYDEWAKFSDNETSDILNSKQWEIFVESKLI